MGDSENRVKTQSWDLYISWITDNGTRNLLYKTDNLTDNLKEDSNFYLNRGVLVDIN